MLKSMHFCAAKGSFPLLDDGGADLGLSLNYHTLFGEIKQVLETSAALCP